MYEPVVRSHLHRTITPRQCGSSVLSQQAPVGCGTQFVGHVVLMP
jgi:hypothetical protein